MSTWIRRLITFRTISYGDNDKAIDYYLRYLCINENEKEKDEINGRVNELVESKKACISGLTTSPILIEAVVSRGGI